MRSSAAITLVLLGTGATAVAVDMRKSCRDTVTRQAISCPDTSHGSGWSTRGFSSFSSAGTSTGSSSRSVGDAARGGFGGAGTSMHAAS